MTNDAHRAAETRSGALSRRRFLTLSASACLLAGQTRASEAKHPTAEKLSQAVREYMTALSVPGGQLVVGRAGRLLFDECFGVTHRGSDAPVVPETRFRIASISKPFTAVAILALVEDGALTLDTRLVDVLRVEPTSAEGRPPDPRLGRITIRQLLQHTAGWDRDKSGDPMFKCRQIATELGTTCPPERREILQWVLGQQLDFDPGARYAYSNLGYCALGRVIEDLTGKSYEQFVRERVFKPAGLDAMRLARTREAAAGEAGYWMAAQIPEGQTGPNLFLSDQDQVAWPYGGVALEVMDSHGGWIASARHLVRFGMTLYQTGPACALRRNETLALVEATPSGAAGHDAEGNPKPRFYGLGFNIVRAGTQFSWAHSGSLPGTLTWLWRRYDGLVWAAVFNQRGPAPRDGEIARTLNGILDRAVEWKGTQ